MSEHALSDRKFFEQAVTACLDGLFGVAMRLTRNRTDAEDLVAETVAKAWAHFASLHDRQAFRGWMSRILTNTWISECRKCREQLLDADEAESDDEGTFSLFEQLHQPFLLWWGDPEREFVNKLLREDLVRALEALPDAYRVVVVLSDIEGYSYQEIAAALDVPIGTVRSRLSRARGLLQRALWEHDPSPSTAPPATPVSDPEPRSEHDGTHPQL